jgi:hypothetical protein
MEVEIGKVIHYYDKINLAVLKLSCGLKLGDTIHIRGRATDVTERLIAMEIDHQRVLRASPGDDALIEVILPVSDNDLVWRVREGDRDLTSA